MSAIAGAPSDQRSRGETKECREYDKEFALLGRVLPIRACIEGSRRLPSKGSEGELKTAYGAHRKRRAYIAKRHPVAVAIFRLVRIGRRIALHHSVQRWHLELQAARRGSGDPCGSPSPRLRRHLIRPSLLSLFTFLGNGGRRGGGGGPVGAPCRHPDGDFATGADPPWWRRDGDVLVVAEARYRTVRDARRPGPARGRSEVR